MAENKNKKFPVGQAKTHKKAKKPRGQPKVKTIGRSQAQG